MGFDLEIERFEEVERVKSRLGAVHTLMMHMFFGVESYLRQKNEIAAAQTVRCVAQEYMREHLGGAL